jgi:hypothetical protein
MQRWRIGLRILGDCDRWFGERRWSWPVLDVRTQSCAGNAGADKTQAGKSDDRCETSREHGSIPRWDVTADSGRGRCVVQRWEMRLGTHQCMVTRFHAVSQSESSGNCSAGVLAVTGNLLVWPVRFASKTNFSSLSPSYSGSLMWRVFFCEEPPKTDLRSFEHSSRPASDRRAHHE